MNTNNIRILLVEDHPDDVFLTLRALSKLNITDVLVKKSGVTAFNYLCQTAEGDLPTLLIVDINMPGLSGIDLIRIIRRTGRLKALPIAVLTSSLRDRDRAACIDLGIVAYFNKPLHHESLAALWRADERPELDLVANPAPQKGPSHETTHLH